MDETITCQECNEYFNNFILRRYVSPISDILDLISPELITDSPWILEVEIELRKKNSTSN
jgi:hypothetical protein